ncbi:MAG: IS21 family transposase [Ruminiclostridium sp.]|nr:IS21 family transposase [Ruminiclostridium sp.]
MTNYREILRLDNLGLNKTQIAEACGYSRTTIIQTLRLAKENQLRYPLPDSMSDKQLADLLFPTTAGKPVFKMPDYEYVYRELQKNGVTLNLLWLEYCDNCRSVGEIPYQSTQFNKYYNDFLVKKNATMHLNHKPGEIMQVDWAGDTATVIDTDTGEAIQAYIFVATLPFSGYSYVEAFFSMKQEFWTAAHVNTYRYFGGVARIIQCDNLKTGVDKHGRNEVTLNQTYRELAEHYGTAVIPARIRTPKDKAMVEGTVGVISTFILAAIRNEKFLSLYELNTAIWERLETFNHKPFQKRDGSRASAFEEEKAFLLPLPPKSFELATWKVATVGPNYHITIDGMNYSVPYEYIKQKVDVRITKGTVEIFFDGNRICSHPRLYGWANQYSTVEDHMPPNHQQYVQWNGERFAKWAAKIGHNTETVVRAILASYKVEQQGYKACMGLLKLADKYSAERLENACKRALTYTPRPSLKNVQTILSSGQDKIQDDSATKSSSSQYGFTRGADYYDRRKK